MLTHNPYKPQNWEIKKIIDETPDVKTFRLFQRGVRPFIYKPGQFVEISIPGAGEAPISITSTPTRPDYLELSIKKTGKVTGLLHGLSMGDVVNIRGPYGRGFPVDELKGEDLLFVAGGIGLAPLRSVINYVLDRRASYGEVIVLYGARSYDDLVFKDDLALWGSRRDMNLLATVDAGCDEWSDREEGWCGRVGVVTTLFSECKMDSARHLCLICGPHIMIKFALAGLMEAGFKPSRIITTLERMMKCGIGKCGHCNIGPKYVCQDGPVFTMEEISRLYEAL
ncbi:MAG: FAD/NAD(P)-binding protein [Chloroflexi bacterium]|nr:FAD/NAD(P)-binding protein [Chloroflexota bacterium]